MKIFTVINGDVMEGAAARKVTIQAADVEIFAICVGETGKGRLFSYIPISGVNADQWVKNVKLSKTRTTKPRFIVDDNNVDDNNTEECIIVFKHTAGYLKGDRVNLNDPKFFRDFPGEILVEGAIAKGATGLMGRTSQYIVKLQKGQVFRIGSLYENPSSYYGSFDGGKVTLITWQDRKALGLWFD
jgi:hypothetical protein